MSLPRVVVPTANYALPFCTPRKPTRHEVVQAPPLVDLRRVWRATEAVATWAPGRRPDLVHTINQVPLTPGPFVVTFESALPRAYGPGREVVRSALRQRLLGSSCRGLVALSEYALRRALSYNAGWDGSALLAERTRVIHPNLPLRRTSPKTWSGGPLRLLFVGRHWARKGGVVAVRLAERARRAGLPVEVTVVSRLQHAGSIYADHPDKKRYAPDVALLDAPGVTVHTSLPNAEVIKLVEESTFLLLPTVHDTYGFSVLESMSVGTPVIATRTAALPEVVDDGRSGYLLDLPVDDVGDWRHLQRRSWDELDALYDDLADQTLVRLSAFLEEPATYEQLSAGALQRIREHHDAPVVGELLESVYDSALAAQP